MSKKWALEPPATDLKTLAEHGIPRLLAQLLYNRGLKDPEIADMFLHPAYERMHSPFLFKDMEVAVSRIWQAVEAGERIAIYGDYDADAVTANAVLQQTFRYLGIEVTSYIPDRFTEGYGLNIEAFMKLKEQGITLVITVDCGTNSVDVAEFCNREGIDLIITDHHEIIGDRPQSLALINPKNPFDAYPDDQVTGVGVAYKLAVALLHDEEKVKQRREVVLGQVYTPHWDKWLLDLVAIGTVADCHSLFGENRLLVGFGLRVITKTKWVGLSQLLALAARKGSKEVGVTAYTLGFIVAPRINAAGRLEHAGIALDLLMSTKVEEAAALAERLETINTRRQELTARLVSEAKEQAELAGDRKILVLSARDWPKGVVGLVAGRLASDYSKPVIVLEQGEKESTGSARSVGNFDIVECFKSTQEFLVKFGGHKQAAGLTVKTEMIDAFRAAVIKYADQHLDMDDLQIPLVLEAQLEASDISVETVDMIALLEPFGVGNPKPKFLIKDVVVESLKQVGKTGAHVQVVVTVKGSSVQGIGFNMGYICDTIVPGAHLDIACELIADEWNGIRRCKFRLIDFKESDVVAN